MANFKCAKPYSLKDFSKVKRVLKTALDEGNFNDFLNYISGYKFDTPTALDFKITPATGENEAIESRIDLMESVMSILIEWKTAHRDSTFDVDDLYQQTKEVLQITDSSTVDNPQEDVEIKSIFEEADNNTTDLEKHLEDFYGRTSFNIVTTLQEDFCDMMVGCSLFDLATNNVVAQNNETLNRNIKAQKANLFQIVVKYLKDNYKDNKIVQSLSEELYRNGGKLAFYNYTKALNAFYKLVVGEGENHSAFQQELQTLHDGRLKSGVSYEGLFTEVQKLLNTENFNVDKLTAANAYSVLQHFDSMIKAYAGNQVAVLKGTENVELFTDDKYSYNLGTEHQKKSWGEGEDINSEKFTSNQLKMVVNSIRMYHYKTGQFLNQRMNVTDLIAAFSNLRSAVHNNNDFRILYKNGVTETITDLFSKFHGDPVNVLHQILETLFDKSNRIKLPSTQNRTNKSIINEHDLNVLKSLYGVLNRTVSDENSFYSQSTRKDAVTGTTSDEARTAQYLVEALSGYLDRNAESNNLQVKQDTRNHTIQVHPIAKGFNDLKTRQLINQTNAYVATQSSKARGQFNFTVSNGEEDTSRYTVTIGEGDNATTLSIDDKRGFARFFSDKDANLTFTVNDNPEFLNTISVGENTLANIIQRLKTQNDQTELSKDEQSVVDLLHFIDSTLGLKILDNPETGLEALRVYADSYKGSEKYPSPLMPMLKLAMRSAYVGSMYNLAGNQNLKSWFTEIQGQDKLGYSDIASMALAVDNESNIFKVANGNIRIMIAAYRGEETFFDNWSQALSILDGTVTASTTKNAEQNSIANYSINKLGNQLDYETRKQLDNPNSSVKSLLFTNNSSLVVDTYNDQDVWVNEDDSKAVKKMATAELYQHAIFEKFFAHYYQNPQYDEYGTIVIQPTCFSDKTTFLNYEINPRLNGEENNLMTMTEDQIITQYQQTIGAMYSSINNKYITKVSRIAQAFATINQDLFTGEDVTTFDYNDIATINKVFHHMSEQQLIDIAKELGIDVELHKDYRLLKNSAGATVLGVNELNGYNARVYNNPNSMKQLLNTQKHQFLQQLLSSNSKYQVFESNTNKVDLEDTAESENNHTEGTTFIFDIIKKFKGVKGAADFCNEWVDANTGRLILAKQNGNPILKARDVYDPNVAVTLNPLLEKFFLVEGLVSNNFKLSMPGSEINHPHGKKNPVSVALKQETLTQWNSLGYGQLNKVEFEMLTLAVKENNILDTEDLRAALITGKFNSSPALKQAVINLLNSSYLYNTNTAQQAQFKRNVIIPATLQYVQQMSKDGVPPKIKCAVIRDIDADVFNYRGDSDHIDACDGGAYITSFESIMENRALQDQAVGFTKKPIWYQYDAENGTSFLAKFATNTITNELMRVASNSTVNAFKLFRKMTNLQWNASDNIDLTRDMQHTATLTPEQQQAWFQKTILGNKKLYYKNKYDEIVEIVGFNKENNIYYTDERVQGTNQVVRNYHVFSQNGHTIYNNLAEAQQTLQNTEGHTINSLFELHSALGSIYSCDENGNYNEYNNEVVVNFMSNVGTPKSGTTAETFVNQASYNQPLKQYHIGYALNNTAVKNGAKNINQASAWTDNSELTYFEVQSDGLGMQMNADHEIIDAELTEFSQVIAACAAYGFTYDQCNELFHSLAQASFSSSESLLRSVDKFLNNFNEGNRERALSDLYDAIGRIIFMNQSIKSQENLTHIILQSVEGIFNTYADHSKDAIKVPFSDPSIYPDFIPTLASTITKQSIKRKHPGSGCVMVMGYNMMQYFEIPKADGTSEKLFAPDILKRAKAEYLQELQAAIINSEGASYNEDNQTIQVNGNTYSINTLKECEEVANQMSINGPAVSAYYNESTDVTNYNNHLIETWLQKQQANIPLEAIYHDKSFFMPSDIVEVVRDGRIIEVANLNSLKAYYDFKAANHDANCTFRTSVTSPQNLKPSLIRWQYRDEEGTTRYMNYFDLPHVQDIYQGRVEQSAIQPLVQEALHNIYNGVFSLRAADGTIKNYNILDGTLENKEAELVMSNLYKDTFGIDNENLSEILNQGESYFSNSIKELYAPVNDMFDVAFLKDDGKHLMLTIGDFVETANTRKDPFSRCLITNEKDELVFVQNGKELFEVGKWVTANDIIYDDNNKTFSRNNKVLDPQTCRFNAAGQIQERIDYITRYRVANTVKHKNGKTSTQNGVLYRIADVATFQRAMKVSEEDAARQQASIINKIFTTGGYKLPQINLTRLYSKDPKLSAISQNKRTALRNALKFIVTNRNIDSDIRGFLEEQVAQLGHNDFRVALATLQNAKNSFIENEAHKKWVSFQDSLKVIAARIPAQTLQSFMAMKCVGWTENSTNMCYVSHFQTYLQGSDYDIDKAYIMGQSYDSNALYSKWSPFFDYTSLETLELSKTLPIPKRADVKFDESGVDITEDVQTLLASSDLINQGTPEVMLSTRDIEDETQKIVFLKALKSALTKVEGTKGLYYINGNEISADQLLAISNTLKAHEHYTIPTAVAEAAYKNAASANIYAISHDIRNRDQAYTAIAMNIMRDAADRSPKGEQTANLNMLNPLTKYTMQYQNMVGKNVIGITANGEKFWFNTYYYWTSVLKNGTATDIEYLKFCTSLTRIKGRAEGTQFDPAVNTTSTVTHIPDLDIRDNKIRSLLLEEFHATDTSLEYSFVDQKISQMLSAATDNAKELILAKINAGNNFAKMFLYLMVTGYDVNDIAAFMTSPVSEFIDTMAITNIYQEEQAGIRPYQAVDLAQGIIRNKNFLWGTVPGETKPIPVNLAVAGQLAAIINNDRTLSKLVRKHLGIGPRAKLPNNLDNLMSAMIKSTLEVGGTYDVRKWLYNDTGNGIPAYARYCQDVLEQLQYAVDQYQSRYNIADRTQAARELIKDAQEFKKIFSLASEMSDITTAFLGLNQGLPTDELSLITCMNHIKNIVSSREREFGIRDGVSNATIAPKLKENNRLLSDEVINNTLDMARSEGIMNNFDPLRLLVDPEYRQKVKDYMHILKGTVNAIDLIYKVPHYAQIMDCLKALVVGNTYLSYKSRLVSQLIGNDTTLSTKQIRKALAFADETMVLKFLETLPTIVTHAGVKGFDINFNTIDNVNSFDLEYMHDIAGFKNFVETDFLDWIEANHPDNPLSKHLKKTIDSRSNVVSLMADVDLLKPNTSITSKLAYDDIVRGIAQFEGVPYANSGYSVASIFQLYNLIMNLNNYGSDRLTTIFKNYTEDNNILNQYFNFLSNLDINVDSNINVHQEDYQISIAPFVSKVGANVGEFVKVRDPNWEYSLYKWDDDKKSYKPIPFYEPFKQKDPNSDNVVAQQFANYKENCKFVHPYKVMEQPQIKVLTDVPLDLQTVQDLIVSGRILIFKNC